MRTKFITAMLTLAIGALAAAPAALGQDVWEQEFDVEPGQKIELKMKWGGSLDVEGWDRDAVSITCEANHNDIEDWEFEVEETRTGLRFEADLPRSLKNQTNLVVTLRVPHRFDIETSSGGGHVSIKDVEGEFRGKSAGGGITLENVKGEVDLRTGGGWIEVVDCDLDGEVRSGGGGGEIRNVTGDFEAYSGGGAISYENVRDEDGEMRGPEGTTSGTIVQTSMGGGIEIDHAPEGVYAKTGGGEVEISGARRFVEAWTGGGDMEIEVTDGWVEVFTGAGDVEISVRGGFGDGPNGIEVFTGYGEVTITVPENASIEFDVDLTYTRNSSENFRIRSDFDLELEHTKEWDKSHGTPSKHIYGTGTVNGGDHLVKIRNVNGDVRIRTR